LLFNDKQTDSLISSYYQVFEIGKLSGSFSPNLYVKVYFRTVILLYEWCTCTMV